MGLGFVSFFIMLVKDWADEYEWKMKCLHAKSHFVVGMTLALLITYTLLFGVLNGGSFIYFQF